MTYMKRFLMLMVLLTLAVASAIAQSAKTDLAREVYVESSKPDFPMIVTPLPSASANLLVWEIKPPEEGSYTLICFIDGKFWSRQTVKLPTPYKLNTRGLAPGRYQMTLQLVDRQGRLGVERIQLVK